MPRCTNCGRDTPALWVCGLCESLGAGRRFPTCRLCHANMPVNVAICPTCGATGNPKGTPPPAHLKVLFKQALDSKRETGGPVLLVCHPSVSRAYILRVLRENYRATEADLEGFVFAIPDALPPAMSFKAVFVDEQLGEERAKKIIFDLRERPPPPSVWDWLRHPVV